MKFGGNISGLRKSPLLWLIAFFLFARASAWASPPVVTVAQNAASLGRYDIYELSLTNFALYANPWEDPTITAVFTAPSGTNYTVGGFYCVTNLWKVRFAPMQIGAWSWTLAFTDNNGTFNTSGAFTVTNSAYTGFLRRNPNAPFGLVTELNGAPFYAHGFETSLPNNAALGLTNLAQFNFHTDGYQYPVPIQQYLALYGRAGFNTLREMNEQDGFYLIQTFNNNSTGKNLYDMDQGLLCDQLMAALRQADWKCVMTFWASALSGYNVTNPPGSSTTSQACLRFHQYVINRYAAYVDVWELLNEQQNVPESYSQVITSYVRTNDPYGHLITINYSQTYGSLFDLETFHGYYPYGPPEAQVVQSVDNNINALKSFSQPIMSTELGNEGPYGAYDPLRFRIINWSAFFNRGMLLFTLMGSKSAYAGIGGLSNQYMGSEERASMKILTDYLAGFDPTATNLPLALSPGTELEGWALAGSQDLGLYVLDDTSENQVVSNGTVTLTVPAGNMQGEWLNPATGNIIEPVAVNSGSQTLPIPAFVTDIALRLQPAVTQPVVQFSSSCFSTNANQGNVTLTVYRTGGPGNAVTASYATSDGLAQAGVNYTATNGTLSWEPNDVSPRTIVVPLLFSGALNADLDFLVSLTNLTGGAELGPAGTALVTLVNPITDFAAFSAPSYTIAPGSTNATFTVNRTGNGNGPLTVYYSTRTGSAIAGKDYVATPSPATAGAIPSPLTWSNGDFSPRTFSVPILNSSPASNITFAVALDDGVWPSPMTPEPLRSLVTMLGTNTAASPGILAFDNDTNMTVQGYGFPAASTSVPGTNVYIAIPVSRTSGSNGAVGVTYTLAGGTAQIGVDFDGTVQSTLFWTNGDAADKNIYVPIVNSALEKGTVTTWLQLSSPTGGVALGALTVASLNIDYSGAVVQPAVVIAPVAQTVPAGQAATFSVVASGTALVYQWLFNGTNIAGATNATYTIPLVNAADAGAYSVIISNAANHVAIAGISLTVGPPVFSLTSIGLQTNNVIIVWTTTGGGTNVVQATTNLLAGFTDISSNIFITGTGAIMTNYLDIGAATSSSMRFYRVRTAP